MGTRYQTNFSCSLKVSAESSKAKNKTVGTKYSHILNKRQNSLRMAPLCYHQPVTHSPTTSEDGKHSSLKRFGKRAGCWAFVLPASKKGVGGCKGRDLTFI